MQSWHSKKDTASDKILKSGDSNPREQYSIFAHVATTTEVMVKIVINQPLGRVNF